MKAYFVYFEEIGGSTFTQGNYGYIPVNVPCASNKPILVVSNTLEDVAKIYPHAKKIEQIDAKEVHVVKTLVVKE